MLNQSNEKTKSLQARIVAGSLVLLSGSTLATVINLAYNVAVARLLGPRGFGHATVVYTLLTLVSAVTLSFQIITAKVVAQQPSIGGKGAAYRDLHRTSWAFGLAVAAALLVFRNAITVYLNLPAPVLVELLAIGAAFYVPLGARRGYIQGAFGFGKLATNLVVEGGVRLGGSLAAILLGTGVTGVIAANAVAMAVTWVAIPPAIGPSGPNPLRFRYTAAELTQALVFFAGQVLINNSSIVLVKHYFLPLEAGLYAAVAMVGRVIFTLSQAVVNSMFPLVAGTSAEERKNMNVLTLSLLLVFGMGSALALILRVMPATVWSVLLGAKFATSGHYSLSYLLALFAFTTVIYSLSVVLITYEMSYKIANTSWVQLAFSAALIAAICRYHRSLFEVIVVQLVLMTVLLLAVGIPFAADGLRKRKARFGSAVRLLRRISEDEVIAAFLKSDFENAAYRDYHDTLRPIVAEPNLEDASECAKRRALLFLRHRSLWKELPGDTEWYEVEIRDTDLDQVRVFPRAQWRRLARRSFAVPDIVKRIQSKKGVTGDPFLKKISVLREKLGEREAIPGTVLLIGQTESEPVTIIDGNHRFVAAAMAGCVGQMRLLCGLSPRMTRCCWYKTNPVTLTRYARNLLRHLTHHPEAELARLFENSG